MSDNVLAQLMAIRVRTTQEFKQHWREFFGREPPASSPCFLESWRPYQIQELVYDRLRPEAMQRPEALGQQLDYFRIDVQRKCIDQPIDGGMRLIYEWQQAEHTVTPDGHEWQCWSYKLLSAVPWEIAGIRQKGWTFVGCRTRRAVDETRWPGPLATPCGYPWKFSEEGLGMAFNARRATTGSRGLHWHPEGRGLGSGFQPLRQRRLLEQYAGATGAEAAPDGQ